MTSDGYNVFHKNKKKKGHEVQGVPTPDTLRHFFPVNNYK